VRTPGAVTAPAPRLGQHTEAILGGLLQYAPARIGALRASGALGGSATLEPQGGVS
jgi:crotonobetainyl-CoA:carnitine CoA-transferase CaiB-like acyl-CoA transferase